MLGALAAVRWTGMRSMALAIGLALIGCKKSGDNPSPGVTAGSGSARPVALDAAPSAAPSGLAFDPPDNLFEGIPDASDLAFDHKVPRLPAVSADGTQIAELASDVQFSGPPEPPIPWAVRIYKLDEDAPAETLSLLGPGEFDAALKAGSAWATADEIQRVKARGAKALARLKGFRSLEPLKADGELVKIGELTLTTAGSDDPLVVELRDAKHGVLHRLEQPSYGTGDDVNRCGYTPTFGAAYRDAATRTVYYKTAHHYRDDCDEPRNRWVGWSLDPAKADPAATIAGMATEQFDLVGENGPSVDDTCVGGAPVITNGAIRSTAELRLVGVADKPMDYSGSHVSDLAVTLSRDGQSAWASATASIALLATNTPGRDVPWRASDVLVKTARGWRFAALAWTEPVANSKANGDAKAGKLQAASLDGEAGDQSLRDAFAKLARDGLVSSRDDLVAIGSGPGERTTSGAAFARAWNAAWKGKVAIVSSVARLLPSATTGWVAATIALQKPGYQLPFTVFAVFDKDASGAWTLVHIHFAT